MKNKLILVLLFGVLSVVAKAQTQSSAFNSGDNLFNAGVGVGTPFFGSGYSSSIPVNPTITFEHGVTDVISIGGTLSYASSKFDLGSGFSFKENAIYVGARCSYHFNQLLNLSGSKADIYGGISAGYVIVSVTDNQGGFGATASGAGYGLFAGAKYYFMPKFGVYAELGYESLSFLNVGVAFKF